MCLILYLQLKCCCILHCGAQAENSIGFACFPQNFLLSGKSGRQGKGALRPGVPTYVSCAAGFYPNYPQGGIIRVSSPTQCMDGKLELVRNSLYSCFRGNCQSFSRKCRGYIKFHFLRIFWFGEIFANVFSY